MSIDRRILENTTMLAASQVVAQLANFGFIIVFARTFGASLLGEYAFALSLGAVLAAIIGLGSRQLILRAASADIEQWRHLLGIFWPVQIISTITVFCLVLAGAGRAGLAPDAFWTVTLVCLFQLIAPFTPLVAASFSAQERMAHIGLAEALRSVAIFVCGTIFIWIGLSAPLTVAVMPAMALTAVIGLYRLACAEFGTPSFRFDRAQLLDAVRRALPFLGIALSSILFVRVGVVLLRAIDGAEAAGVFSAAERLVLAAVLLQTMFINAMFPQLVKSWRADESRFRKLVAQGQRLILLVTLPGATILAVFAEDIVLLLFGAGYSGAERVLRIVAWMLVIRGVHALTATVAIAQDRQTDVMVAKLVGILALTTMCLVLAPRYGATGLAVAVIVAELSVLVTMVWRLGRSALISSLWTPAARTLAACLIAMVAALALGHSPVWIRAPVVLGAGSLAMWLSRAVSWGDVEHFFRVLGSRPAD